MRNHHSFLLVDDDHRVRVHVREMLAEEYPSAEFLEAGSAEEALWLATTNAPSFILLDCHMPGRSGMKALPDLRKTQPEIPIVMLSGESADAYGPAALRAGATAFVSKESGMEGLVQVVRRLTDDGGDTLA